MQKCVICGDNLALFGTSYDDRYGYPGLFSILKCGACGHKSLDAHFTLEELGRLYTEFYPRSQFSLEDYTPSAELTGFRAWIEGAKSSAFRWVPQNVRVLDIGCGFGETLGYHKKRGCDVYGVEADENIKRVAEKYGYNVHIGVFTPGNYEAEFFDYVTMDQVIEHLSDPIASLQGVAQVTKPGGSVIISTPNSNGWGSNLFGARWISWHIPYHLQFFSKTSMSIAAEKTGFVVEKSKTITNSAYLCLQWNHIKFRPPEGFTNRFWILNQKFTRYEKIYAKAMTALNLFKVNQAITRFFDSTGFGDNFVFVLRKK
jgi:2-polyprenyl-3-methyl-5-hydroxy-6-metoxy-1,4-benzoquinol methylase